MKYKAILFDLDDTLVVDEACAEEAFLATCEYAHVEYGVNPEKLHQSVRQHSRQLWSASPTIAYCRAIGISSWEGLWAQFLGDDPNLKALHAWAPTYRRESWFRALVEHDIHDLPFAERLAATFRRERRTRHVIFPDAIPVLNNLQGTYQLGLVTNGVPDLQHEKLNGTKLGQYFDEIVISGVVGIGKPDPRIFDVVLKSLGAQPAEAVMVGNSLERDIVGAQRAGIQGIWLNRSAENYNGEIIPDVEITNLNELYSVLH